VSATNSYVEYDQKQLDYDTPRIWTPMTRAELLHFIGCLFYMGLHKEILREDYWERG
jgi:hypothetical protein